MINNRTSFTKKWIGRILTLLIVSLIFTYGVILLGLINFWDNLIIDALVRLSESLVNVILGTTLGYLMKSYFETKQQEKIRLQEREMEIKSFNRHTNDNNDKENKWV